jgi:hypothetical protein
MKRRLKFQTRYWDAGKVEDPRQHLAKYIVANFDCYCPAAQGRND